MFLIRHVMGPNVGLFLGNQYFWSYNFVIIFCLSYASLFVLRLNPIFVSPFSYVSCGVDRISALKYWLLNVSHRVCWMLRMPHANVTYLGLFYSSSFIHPELIRINIPWMKNRKYYWWTHNFPTKIQFIVSYVLLWEIITLKLRQDHSLWNNYLSIATDNLASHN